MLNDKLGSFDQPILSIIIITTQHIVDDCFEDFLDDLIKAADQGHAV